MSTDTMFVVLYASSFWLISAGQSWGDILLFEAFGSERAGLDLFWTLWDEFSGTPVKGAE